MNAERVEKSLFILIILTLVVRLVTASFFHLGPDEAYFWVLAKFHDYGHVDYPPMVGWMVQFFTFDLYFDSAFALRIGNILIAAANTWIIFSIGRKVKSPIAGWFAAALYSASYYFSVFSGVFISPDAPQLFFWLLAIKVMLVALHEGPDHKRNLEYMLFMGIAIGLAMMSKYSAVFLWVGVLLYVAVYDRRWLSSWSLYLSLLITAFTFMPVIWWNFENDWVGCATLYTELTDFGGLSISEFLYGILGELFFLNPLVVLLVILAMRAIWKVKNIIDSTYLRILLFTSFPLLFSVWIYSLFGNVEIHWSGPGYIGLLILTGAYLEWRTLQKYGENHKLWTPSVLSTNFILLIGIVSMLATSTMGYGLGNKEENEEKKQISSAVYWYGWDQVEKLMEEIDISDKNIVVDHLFGAAQIDYYIARPKGMNFHVLGKKDDIKKFYWVSKETGELQSGSDALWVVFSDQLDENSIIHQKFEKVTEIKRFPILLKDHTPLRELLIFKAENSL